MKMKSNDSMVLTMVVSFAMHSTMHLYTIMNCLNFGTTDEKERLISDLRIMNDDDENLSEQDEWLLDVPVRVLLLFVVAILFDDFETRSTKSV